MFYVCLDVLLMLLRKHPGFLGGESGRAPRGGRAGYNNNNNDNNNNNNNATTTITNNNNDNVIINHV